MVMTVVYSHGKNTSFNINIAKTSQFFCICKISLKCFSVRSVNDIALCYIFLLFFVIPSLQEHIT